MNRKMYFQKNKKVEDVWIVVSDFNKSVLFDCRQNY